MLINFLSNPENYDKDCNIEDNFHVCTGITLDTYEFNLTVVEDKDNPDELDASFCIDYKKWFDFVKNYEVQIGVSYYYWPK